MFSYCEGYSVIFTDKTIYPTHTQSQNHKPVHMVLSAAWKPLSLLISWTVPNIPPLHLSYLPESEKSEETLPIFMSLQLEWLRRSWLGDRAVGGGWALLGQGTVLLGHGTLLLWAWCRGWAVELWWGTKAADVVRLASDQGQEVTRGGDSVPQMTQGFGHFSFCWAFRYQVKLVGFKPLLKCVFFHYLQACWTKAMSSLLLFCQKKIDYPDKHKQPKPKTIETQLKLWENNL
jgi:hypothetical protein